MIKKYWIYGLFVFAVIVFIITTVKKTNSKKEGKVSFEVSVIRVDSGFGYEISKNKQPFIRQTVIPAIEGEKTFVNNIQALKTGQLVVYKMEHNLMPNISVKELDSLQIIR